MHHRNTYSPADRRPAATGQPKTRKALAQLQIAREDLQNAEPNKGGHREEALQLVNEAINQVQAGASYAAGH